MYSNFLNNTYCYYDHKRKQIGEQQHSSDQQESL